MQTPDRRCPCTLNSSQARATVSSRILDRYAGTGVNYIALRTQDIFAVAEQLQQAGTALMHVPENYYDDLVARFGLSDALRERLEQSVAFPV
ncbi:MAG: hypothetical protein R3E95_17150 [Thiolinea sp.]